LRSILLVLALPLAAAEPYFLPEFARPDPSGAVVPADRPASPVTALKTPRGGYVSAHLVFKHDAPQTLSVDCAFPVDLFLERHQNNYPDALIPVRQPYQSQSTQTFWIDVWIPADAKPGRYALRANAATLTLEVLGKTFHPGDAIVMDHNSYGIEFLSQQYPKIAAQGRDAVYGLVHAHHRLFYGL
jgi:hypothetical protein